MAEVDNAHGEVDKAEDSPQVRSEKSDALWSEIRIDPIEIALPRGVGYTLRAYRPADEVTLSEVTREEDDFTVLERAGNRDDLEEEVFLEGGFEDEDEDEEDEEDDAADDADGADADADEVEDLDVEGLDEDDEPDDDESDDDAPEQEEVPVFLGHSGKLYLFSTPESLASFIQSDEEHDLTQIEGWAKLRENLMVEDLVANDSDRYELDLIVDNLRGGHDVWDTDLLIRAGEIARDLGYALRIDPIITALAPGSPLDDLDEALRATSSGMIGSFFARRKLRKIGAQQATLGWRTIIGKISAAVDWRE